MSSLLLPMLAAFAIGYLLGSIPFGLLLTRAAGLGDVRKIGSGNIGATNVLRTGNKALAAATLLLDGLKGTLAVLLSTLAVTPFLAPAVGVDLSSAAAAAEAAQRIAARAGVFDAAPWMAGLGAVVGHVYPVWLGFKGGKGIATYLGVLIGAHFAAALVFSAVWLATAAVMRISSLASLLGLLAVLVYSAYRPHPVVLMAVTLTTALMVWKHRENIQRLLAGTESRIGDKSKPETAG